MKRRLMGVVGCWLTLGQLGWSQTPMPSLPPAFQPETRPASTTRLDAPSAVKPADASVPDAPKPTDLAAPTTALRPVVVKPMVLETVRRPMSENPEARTSRPDMTSTRAIESLPAAKKAPRAELIPSEPALAIPTSAVQAPLQPPAPVGGEVLSLPTPVTAPPVAMPGPGLVPDAPVILDGTLPLSAEAAPIMPQGVTKAPYNPFPELPTLAYWYAQPFKGPRAWMGVEQLIWWIKPGRIDVPVVNTLITPENLLASPAAGSVADPNAVTVYGSNNLNFGTFAGLRVFGGFWFDSCQKVGMQTSFFFLEQRSNDFFGKSNAEGFPAIVLPFNRISPIYTGPSGAVIAGPVGNRFQQGAVEVRSTTQLWGNDTEMLFRICQHCNSRWDLLMGYKYLNLTEDLSIASLVQSSPFGAGGTFDQFTTTNNFNGGTLGLRYTWMLGEIGLDAYGKVALGATQQNLNIEGASAAPLTGAAVPGGLYAVSSNIGHTTRDRFSVVPQVGMNMNFEVCDWMRVSFGYTWMYWTNVMRPGSQIDPNINPNLVPIFGGSAAGTGPQTPTRLYRETDFFAHGVNLTMIFTY